MKRRLGEPTLTPMETAFARQQTLSKQALGALQASPFAKQLVMGYEDVLDQVGVIQEDNPLGAEAKPYEVAVALGGVGQKSNGIFSVRQKRQPPKLGGWSGREVVFRHGLVELALEWVRRVASIRHFVSRRNDTLTEEKFKKC
jgi:hypothetical protein